MKAVLHLVYPLVVGALLSLAYEPVGAAWLVWIIPALLVLGIWAFSPAQRAGRWGAFYGFFAGAGFFFLNVKWLHSVSPFAASALALFLTLFWVFWGFIVAKWMNPYRCLVVTSSDDSMAARVAARRPQNALSLYFLGSLRSVSYACAVASAWVLAEWLRSFVLTGFPWNGLGLAVADSIVMAQTADLVGVTGLSFLPVFVAAVMVQAGRRLIVQSRNGRLRPSADFAVAVLLIVAAFAYGTLRIKGLKSLEGPRIGVALVQQNIPQSIKWQDRSAMEIYDGYIDGSVAAIDGVEALQREHFDEVVERSQESGESEPLAPLHLDFLVWPETAVPEPMYFTEDGDTLVGLANRNMLEEEIFPRGDFVLISGMNEVEMEMNNGQWVPKHGGRAYNSILGFAESTDPVARYRKAHRVIYGEYIPLIETVPALKNIYEWATGETYYGNIAAGKSYDPLPIERRGLEFSIIPSICFEDSIARLARRFVRDEPQVIINVTNDGWFFETEAALQHAANARMRAIELRRPMVRAANTGLSVVYDHIGRIVETPAGGPAVIRDGTGKDAHFTEGWTFAEVTLLQDAPRSLYAIAGDWFCWLCTGFVVIWGARRSFRKRAC